LELFRSAMKSKIEGYMYEQGDSSSSSSSSDSDDDDDEDDQKQGTALQQTKLDHIFFFFDGDVLLVINT
jgi:hypothetical protein